MKNESCHNNYCIFHCLVYHISKNFATFLWIFFKKISRSKNVPYKTSRRGKTAKCEQRYISIVFVITAPKIGCCYDENYIGQEGC